MFTDSMLEVTWAQRSRRSWTTLTSFGLQVLVISLLLLLPLWKTVGLPKVWMASTPISLGRPDIRPTTAPPHGGTHSGTPTTAVVIPFVQPGSVPIGIHNGPIEPAPEPPGDGKNGIPGLGLYGAPDGVPLPISAIRFVPTPAPPPVVHRFRTASMLEGSLVRRVLPVYPPLARSARVQGPVVLAATISRAGTIEGLHAMSGHPMLVGAAIEAVRQWRYRPYILDNEPVEVDTEITVNFTLAEI